MDKIEKLAEDFLRGAQHDYIGLWEIPSVIRRDFRLIGDNERVKQLSLAVVRLLVAQGLVPGDYLKSGFKIWSESDPAATIARIDREWDPARGDPTLGDPICWFDLKQQA